MSEAVRQFQKIVSDRYNEIEAQKLTEQVNNIPVTSSMSEGASLEYRYKLYCLGCGKHTPHKIVENGLKEIYVCRCGRSQEFTVR